MIGACSHCGADPGFDWAVCPSCGNRGGNAGGGRAQPQEQAGQSSPGRWDKTIIEPTIQGAPETGRARFSGRGDFYTPVTAAQAGRPALGFDGPATTDRTQMDRAGQTISRGDEPSEHTILERPPTAGGPVEDGDHTVIMRGNRRGVTGPLVYVVQRNGIRAGKVYLLSDETDIGRGPSNDIVLGDETVSKRHAKIRLEDGRFVLWDLASSNYSFVVNPDGTRTRILEPHQLGDGDTVDFGDARITFIEVDRAEDA